MGDTLTPRPTYVLIRGDYTDHGDEVQPRGLAQIFPWDPSLPRTASASRAGCSTRRIR